MFKSFFRKRNIRKCARKLPRELKAQYGQKAFYSKEQVDEILRRKNLVTTAAGSSILLNSYAYAMYCSPEEFEQIRQTAGAECDYQATRTEISDTVFNGSSDFNFSSLLAVSAPSMTNFTDSSSSDGGFGGGFGDGGGGADGGC